jgi:hypothetical protein
MSWWKSWVRIGVLVKEEHSPGKIKRRQVKGKY